MGPFSSIAGVIPKKQRSQERKVETTSLDKDTVDNVSAFGICACYHFAVILNEHDCFSAPDCSLKRIKAGEKRLLLLQSELLCVRKGIHPSTFMPSEACC